MHDNPITPLAPFLFVPRGNETFEPASRIVAALCAGEVPQAADWEHFSGDPIRVLRAIVECLSLSGKVSVTYEVASLRALLMGEPEQVPVRQPVIELPAVEPDDVDEIVCDGQCDPGKKPTGKRLGPCSKRGPGYRCPCKTYGGQCKACKRRARQGRTNRRKHTGHTSSEWKTFSARYLVGKSCECDDHLLVPTSLRPPAEVLNHRDGLGPNGPRGYSPSNIQPMTARCHNKLTAREQPGGWNDRE